jgi:hypothetical protein
MKIWNRSHEQRSSYLLKNPLGTNDGLLCRVELGNDLQKQLIWNAIARAIHSSANTLLKYPKVVNLRFASNLALVVEAVARHTEQMHTKDTTRYIVTKTGIALPIAILQSPGFDRGPAFSVCLGTGESETFLIPPALAETAAAAVGPQRSLCSCSTHKKRINGHQNNTRKQ